MKKILAALIMALMMMAGTLFAYEPKKECAKVKRNGDIKYYEKTELYNIFGFEPDPRDSDTQDYDSWVIRKGYTVEQCVDYNYGRFESLRNRYYFCCKNAIYPEISKADKSFVDTINAISGSNITPEEYERKTWTKLALRDKRTAIISIPFVTEKNFLTLTKEEMLEKMYAFIEDVKAENK